MEVKPGYKQTEIGIIPEDWEVKHLSAITEPQRPISYGIVQTGPNVMNGVPCLRVLDINDGQINNADLITTTRQISNAYKRTILKEGDLVMPLRGKVGDVGIIDRELEGANLTRGVALIAVRPAWSGAFCRQLISWSATRKRLEQTMNGSALQEIPIASLRSFQIALPPTEPEQRAIAEALSDVDGLLGGLDRLIAKKRDLKQAAMQQLLTAQTRLPGFHGEWEVKRLGDVVDIKKGQLITSDKTRHGDIPVIAGGKEPAYYHDVANRQGRTITISASGASAGYVALYNTPIFASDCSTISEGRSYSLEFIFYQLLLKQGLIYKAQTGGAQPHIHAVDLMPIEAAVPPLPEQTAIAEVLSELDAELAGLEQRREKTRALKQAMMQELLTGRTRLVATVTSNVIPVDFTARSPAPSQATPTPVEKAHNWAINEAVVVAVLVKHFGSEKFPLGRKRCTKLSYLLHRHVEHVAQGYLKKAAGPYNPAIKYRGPESIAQKNGYICPIKSGAFSGYIAAEKIAQAERYFAEWYGPDVLGWLEQFRFKTNDDLERLTTVDMAMEELRSAHQEVSLDAVRTLIASEPEWVPKLDRSAFSDPNITSAIQQCRTLFPA